MPAGVYKRPKCCDSQECKDYKARTKKKKPYCLTKKRIYERARKNKRKRTIISYLGGECVDCGMKHAAVDKVTKVGNETFAPQCAFDIEHTLWEKKTMQISHNYLRKWEIIKKELDDCECVLLCKVCHQIRSTELAKDLTFRQKQIDAQTQYWKDAYNSGKLSNEERKKAPQALNSTTA